MVESSVVNTAYTSLHFSKISANRSEIVGVRCTCKARCHGSCKHADAVSMFVSS